MEERTTTRVVTDANAECAVRDRITSARIWDLSVGGCKLQVLDSELAAGDQVVVRLELGIVAPGEIIWQARDFAGVRFAKALHEAVVRHLDVAKLANMGWFEVPSLPHPLQGLPEIP